MEVSLAVYDLSFGLASSLSRQFLGVHVPLVPHTGVVVTLSTGERVEYFFGGGIQRLDPESFRSGHGIRPLRETPMGRTCQTPSGIEAWLAANGPRFTPRTYDLLRHNCNNFSDAFLRECLGLSGVPSDVLDVPRRFVESPMGSVLAPMISDMYRPFNGPEAAPEAPPPPPTMQPAQATALDFSALLGAPQPPPRPPEDYTSELAELRLMGFDDEAKNLECLRRAGGDLGLAIDYISEG